RARAGVDRVIAGLVGLPLELDGVCRAGRYGERALREGSVGRESTAKATRLLPGFRLPGHGRIAATGDRDADVLVEALCAGPEVGIAAEEDHAGRGGREGEAEVNRVHVLPSRSVAVDQVVLVGAGLRHHGRQRRDQAEVDARLAEAAVDWAGTRVDAAG